jgi:imidazolonepropionase-like amidohydrolase
LSAIQIFKNARVIDGSGKEPVENGCIIIDGPKIIHAGKDDSRIATKYPRADVIDLKGMTLMPGLIDAHVHLSLHGSPSYFNEMIMESPILAALKAVKKVNRIIESGFTTIRTMGDKGQLDIAMKTAITEGDIIGPRLRASGNCLTITGGHGDMFPAHVNIQGMGRIVDGPSEARKAAREQIKAGADNVKLMATGGGMSPGPPTVSQLTIEEMRAAVEEAVKYGKTTAAHAIGADGIKNALKAGVRTIEHGSFLDEEGIDLLLTQDAYLVPTLAAFKTIKYGKEGGVPEYTIEKVQYFQTAHTKNLKKAMAAGVNIIVGTDAGTPFNYHGESAYELECLVDNGFTEMQAIQAATKTAAQALLLPDLGTLEKGKVADLIVVDGNPLKDIKILQNVEKVKMVYKGGQLVLSKPLNERSE